MIRIESGELCRRLGERLDLLPQPVADSWFRGEGKGRSEQAKGSIEGEALHGRVTSLGVGAIHDNDADIADVGVRRAGLNQPAVLLEESLRDRPQINCGTAIEYNSFTREQVFGQK